MEDNKKDRADATAGVMQFTCRAPEFKVSGEAMERAEKIMEESVLRQLNKPFPFLYMPEGGPWSCRCQNTLKKERPLWSAFLLNGEVCQVQPEPDQVYNCEGCLLKCSGGCLRFGDDYTDRHLGPCIAAHRSDRQGVIFTKFSLLATDDENKGEEETMRTRDMQGFAHENGVKELTLANVLNEPDGVVCKRAKDRLVQSHSQYGLYGVWPKDKAVCVARQLLREFGADINGETWLQEHGYLPEPVLPYIPIGAKFRRQPYSGTYYVLAYGGNVGDHVMLVNMDTGWTWNGIVSPVYVENGHITAEAFNKAFGPCFARAENVEVARALQKNRGGITGGIVT